MYRSNIYRLKKFIVAKKISYKILFIEILRRGKRIPPEKEAFVHLTGIIILLSLIVVISYFDIARIITGDSLLK